MKKIILMFLIVISSAFANFNEEFLTAVEDNNIIETKVLLKLGADIETKEPWLGKTALMIASSKNFVEMTQLLLNKGAKIEAQNKDGFTPLIWAVWTNSLKTADLLLKKGAKIEAKTKTGDNVLHLVALQGNIDTVAFLLNKGANIEAENGEKKTPLFIAIENGKEDLVEYLIGRGANINIKNEKKQKPIFYAIEKDSPALVSKLIKKGVNIEEKNDEGQTPLLNAIDIEKVDIIQLLLQEKAQINAIDKEGNSPLILASKNAYRDLVITLLDRGADIEGKNFLGNTAFMVAALYDNDGIAEELMYRGADVDTQNLMGRKAIDLAKDNGSKRFLALMKNREKQLIENMAIAIENNQKFIFDKILTEDIDFNTPAKNGEILLIKAIKSGKIYYVNSLLSMGVEIKNRKILFSSTDNMDALKVLLSKGIDLEEKDKNMETVLISATKKAQVEAVKLLVENGAKLDAKDSKGNNLLDLALSSNSDVLIQYFLGKGVLINTKNKDFLLWAVKNNNKAIVEKFMTDRDNIDVRDKEKRSLLALASIYNAKDIADILIKKGLDLNERDKFAYTPIMYAAKYNSKEMAEILIKNKVEFKEAAVIAISADSLEVFKLFDKEGLKVKEEDGNGKTYLMYAAEFNAKRITAYLLDGWFTSEDAKDNNDETALMYAARSGAIEVAEILIKEGANKKVKNKKGENLLDLSKTPQMREFLLSKGVKW